MCVLFRHGRHSRCKEKKYVQEIHQRLRACCEPLAAGCIPVCNYSDNRCLYCGDGRHGRWPAAGSVLLGQRQRFLGLLAFTMQMCLVVVLGSALAQALW